MKRFVIALAAVAAIGMFAVTGSNSAYAYSAYNNGYGNGSEYGGTNGSNSGYGVSQGGPGSGYEQRDTKSGTCNCR